MRNWKKIVSGFRSYLALIQAIRNVGATPCGCPSLGANCTIVGDFNKGDRKRSPLHRWIVAGCLVAGMLVLFGCGGGGEDDIPSQSKTLKIVPTGSSTYSIQANNMDGVAGIELNIAYDAALLANPTVTQGELVSGAMLAANTSKPGIIRIAIISTRDFSGSGQVASISFSSIAGLGGITSITANIINNMGNPLSVQAGI